MSAFVPMTLRMVCCTACRVQGLFWNRGCVAFLGQVTCKKKNLKKGSGESARLLTLDTMRR